MRVRAKFRVNRYECQTQASYPHRTPEGGIDYSKPVSVEMRTIVMSPVYGNGDPEHENTKFWQASPNGEIKLGTVNPAAWEGFKLDGEYYVDFTPAD